MIGLKKNEKDVRPIAVGNCLRRLVAKSAIQTLKEEIAAYLAPHKYGVSIPGGAEMMYHLVQMYIEQNPQHVVVKLDAKNAFNTEPRSVSQRVESTFSTVDPLCHSVLPTSSAINNNT